MTIVRPSPSLVRKLLAAAVCAAAFGGASATTITFDGFGGLNEDGTPDNGDSFASYTEAGYLLAPTSNLLVGKAVGNAIPAVYVDSTASGSAGSFSLTQGGSLFFFTSIDVAAITTNVSYTVTGSLAGLSLYSFSGVVTGRAFTFGAPIVFDTVRGGLATAARIDTLTFAARGTNSFDFDNVTLNVATPVPEPTTAILLLLGLAGMGGLVLRRSRRNNG